MEGLTVAVKRYMDEIRSQREEEHKDQERKRRRVEAEEKAKDMFHENVQKQQLRKKAKIVKGLRRRMKALLTKMETRINERLDLVRASDLQLAIDDTMRDIEQAAYDKLDAYWSV